MVVVAGHQPPEPDERAAPKRSDGQRHPRQRPGARGVAQDRRAPFLHGQPVRGAGRARTRHTLLRGDARAASRLPTGDQPAPQHPLREGALQSAHLQEPQINICRNRK